VSVVSVDFTSSTSIFSKSAELCSCSVILVSCFVGLIVLQPPAAGDGSTGF
jgi:hypothetical protein